MTFTRLLAAALLFCCLPAFSQTQLGITSSGAAYSGPIIHYFPPAATPSEPWRLIAKAPAEVGGVNALDPAHIDRYHPDRDKDDNVPAFVKKAGSTVWTPYFRLDGDGDTTCLKIRSYVVARDNKDSDSTHPVSYSTCQPSSRYGLKTTEMRTSSADR